MTFVGYVALNRDREATAFIARTEPDEHLEQKGWVPVITDDAPDPNDIEIVSDAGIHKRTRYRLLRG